MLPFETSVWMWICATFLVMTSVIVILKFISKTKRASVIGENNDAPFVNLIANNLINFHNMQHFQKPEILRTEEYMQMLSSTSIILFRRHSCLKQSFDHQLLVFHSSGLIQYCEKFLTKTIKDTEDKEPRKLQFNQIIGIIEICVASYALSLLMFIMELSTLKHGKFKKIVHFFTFK